MTITGQFRVVYTHRQGAVLTVAGVADTTHQPDATSDTGEGLLSNLQCSFQVNDPESVSTYVMGALFDVTLDAPAPDPGPTVEGEQPPSITDSPLYGSGMPAETPVV